MEKRIVKNLETATIFQQHLKEGTDRDCVLLAASFLESKLEQLLEDKLVGNDDFKYQLFDSKGTLGTFSSKFQICYSLGLISKPTMENLAIIELLNSEFEKQDSARTIEDLLMTEKVYELTSNLYFEYEVAPRQYFSNVALNELLLIYASYDVIPFKEKIQPTIDSFAKLENREEASILAEAILTELKKK